MLKYNLIMMKYRYSKVFLLLILSVLISGKLFSVTLANQINKPMIVVIDAGHGGNDPGAINKSTGTYEKDVVLGIALKLGKYMNENFPDVKVIFTRNTDVFVPLIDRSRIANKNKADLFISIHANFCGTPSIRGTETFLLGEARTGDNLEVQEKENSVIVLEKDYITTYEGYNPNSSVSKIMFTTIQGDYLKQSLSFAWDIQRQFQSRINSSNRGPKQAGFLVLRMSAMPSVLVESGFISNREEANYLSSEDGQRNIAMSIIEAFRKFKIKNSVGNTPAIADTKSVHSEPKVTVNSKSDELLKNDSNELKQETKQAKKTSDSVDNPSVKHGNKQDQNTEVKQPLPENSAVVPEKHQSKAVKTNSGILPSNNSPAKSNTYYSVQIGASTTSVEPVAANFKGLKNVRKEKSDKYYRYYVGKEASLEKISSILQQIKLKFPQAFVIYFVDGERIIINPVSK